MTAPSRVGGHAYQQAKGEIDRAAASGEQASQEARYKIGQIFNEEEARIAQASREQKLYHQSEIAQLNHAREIHNRVLQTQQMQFDASLQNRLHTSQLADEAFRRQLDEQKKRHEEELKFREEQRLQQEQRHREEMARRRAEYAQMPPPVYIQTALAAMPTRTPVGVSPLGLPTLASLPPLSNITPSFDAPPPPNIKGLCPPVTPLISPPTFPPLPTVPPLPSLPKR